MEKRLKDGHAACGRLLRAFYDPGPGKEKEEVFIEYEYYRHKQRDVLC